MAGGKRILIVEDELMIRMLLEGMLSDLGHTVAAEAGSPSPASAPPSGRITTGSTTPPQPAKQEPARTGPVGDGQVAATSIDEILSNKEGERR